MPCNRLRLAHHYGINIIMSLATGTIRHSLFTNTKSRRLRLDKCLLLYYSDGSDNSVSELSFGVTMPLSSIVIELTGDHDTMLS